VRRLLALACWLVAALAVAAGCVAPASPAGTTDASLVPPPLFDAKETLAEHAPIKSFDGTTLDAWVFRPPDSAGLGRVPIVINFSPYPGNLDPPLTTGGDHYAHYLVDFLVPRGYAVALVSARGTGMSEGCFTIGGPTELKDESVVATALAEKPWSNGNVAATAKSYDGTMAQGLLTQGNPHVRTIVPVSPISELYKYDFFDGVPYAGTGQTFNAYYVAETSLAQRQDPRDPTYERTPTRFCQEELDVQANQVEGAATGDYTPYWQARNYSALLPPQVDASVFYIHGLSDWNVKPDHMVPWIDELRARNVTVKMWLGNWPHEYPGRPDFNATLLRWLDHELKGDANGVEREPLVKVQDKGGVWRDEDAWPPTRATTLDLRPTADGKLAAAPGAKGDLAYIDAPTAVPVLEAARIASTQDAPAETRLVFQGAPLADALRLSGAPTLHVSLSGTGPRATLSATLLLDGKVIDQGFRDLAHRASPATSDPMTPGATYDVLVHFYPQDVVLPQGSVLTLVLSHAAPDGAPVQVLPVPTGALVTVHAGDKTWLELPVLAADDGRFESPPPEDLHCWAC
jgi:X-Pro dipeptidyl-peptidase